MPFRIAGEYLDENGDPIAGASVIANVRGDGSVAGITTTDVLGAFTIDPLPTDAEMLYVSVFQDGFVPQIFDQIEPEEYTIPAPSAAELLLIAFNEDYANEDADHEARLYSRGSYSNDEGETWTLEALAPQYGELVGSPIMIEGSWGATDLFTDLGPITVPSGLNSKNYMVVGMMLHDQGNRYNTSIYVGSNNFDVGSGISVRNTLIISNPAPGVNPRALLRSHASSEQEDLPADGQVRVRRASFTGDGAMNFRIWLQFVNYLQPGSSEIAQGLPASNASLPADLTPDWDMEDLDFPSGGLGVLVIGRENQDDDLGGETVSTNSTTPYVERVAGNTMETGFLPGWGARMFLSTGQQAADASVPENIELDWGAANASENGGIDSYRARPFGLDASRAVTYVDRHSTFVVVRDGINADPVRRTADGQVFTQVPGLPDLSYAFALDVPDWNLTFVSSFSGVTPEGDMWFSTDLVAWSNPTAVTGIGTTVSRAMAYDNDVLVSVDSFNTNVWIFTADQGDNWDTVEAGFGPEDFGEEYVLFQVGALPGVGFAFMASGLRHFAFSADGSAAEYRRITEVDVNFICSDCKYIPFLGVLLAVGYDNDTGESIVAWTASLTEDSWQVMVGTIDTDPNEVFGGFENLRIGVLLDSVVMAGDLGTVTKSDDLVTWVNKTNAGLPWSGIAARSVTFGPPPVFPSITSIDPTTVDEDTGAVTVTITGTNFLPSDTAQFNGADRATTYVSGTELEIDLLAGDVATPGTFSIRVQTVGLVFSNSESFEVTDIPTPTISTIDPDSVEEDLGPETLTITGTGFLPESVGQFEGADRDTTYVSDTELTVDLEAVDTETVGTFQITVENPTTAEVSNEADLEVTETPPAAPTLQLSNRTISGINSVGLYLNNDFAAGGDNGGMVEEMRNSVWTPVDDEYIVGWQAAPPVQTIGQDYEVRFTIISGTLDLVPQDDGFTPLPENTWSFAEWASAFTLYDGRFWFGGTWPGPIWLKNTIGTCTFTLEIRRIDLTGPTVSADITLTRTA